MGCGIVGIYIVSPSQIKERVISTSKLSDNMFYVMDLRDVDSPLVSNLGDTLNTALQNSYMLDWQRTTYTPILSAQGNAVAIDSGLSIRLAPVVGGVNSDDVFRVTIVGQLRYWNAVENYETLNIIGIPDMAADFALDADSQNPHITVTGSYPMGNAADGVISNGTLETGNVPYTAQPAAQDRVPEFDDGKFTFVTVGNYASIELRLRGTTAAVAGACCDLFIYEVIIERLVHVTG